MASLNKTLGKTSERVVALNDVILSKRGDHIATCKGEIDDTAHIIFTTWFKTQDTDVGPMTGLISDKYDGEARIDLKVGVEGSGNGQGTPYGTWVVFDFRPRMGRELVANFHEGGSTQLKGYALDLKRVGNCLTNDVQELALLNAAVSYLMEKVAEELVTPNTLESFSEYATMNQILLAIHKELNGWESDFRKQKKTALLREERPAESRERTD